jgi:hypothetical protein
LSLLVDGDHPSTVSEVEIERRGAEESYS